MATTCSTLAYYTPRNEVVGGYSDYTGIRLSVRPSVCRRNGFRALDHYPYHLESPYHSYRLPIGGRSSLLIQWFILPCVLHILRITFIEYPLVSVECVKCTRAGSIYRYPIYIDILRQYNNRYSDPGTYRLHAINVFYSKIPWNNFKTNKSVQNIQSNYLNSICSVIAWHIKGCVVP
jgi:hypothetical protein